MRVILIIITLAKFGFACALRGGPAVSPAPLSIQTRGERDRARALALAAQYLQRHASPDGRFDYVRRSPVSEKKYNILRHAGTIRALSQYYQRAPSPRSRQVILRATRYLRKYYLRSLPGYSSLLAAVSKPGEESVPRPTAKLGGTALALIALCHAREIDTSFASKDELQAMGRFLIFMQRADGSFHSKYVLEQGFDDTFESLYYPGEAMLALTMLYDVDGDARWLQSALRGAAALINKRRSAVDWPADHWMMIAGAPLLARYSRIPRPAVTAAALREHLYVMASKVLASQRLGGYFARAPRSTPTATRLEGLAAVIEIQARAGKSDPILLRSVASGIDFLLHCQSREPGPNKGGVPRLCAENAASVRRGREIRIDYVQHFMSALLTAPE